MIRHRLAPGLLAMDAADPPLRFEPLLVGLTAVGRIGPNIRGGIVARHDVPEHPAIEARAIGDLALADEAEGSANRDAAFVAEAGDGDVDLRLAVRRWAAFGELQRPARTVSFCAARAGSSGQISAATLPALIAAFSGSVLRCLGAATSVASTICPPMAR